ncbi:MAG: hypothetical protein LBU14_05175 [Candidatus Peribacteria bacterium]|nr:hypothetical protein [Candidatus Peribacteria bacterium]
MNFSNHYNYLTGNFNFIASTLIPQFSNLTTSNQNSLNLPNCFPISFLSNICFTSFKSFPNFSTSLHSKPFIPSIIKPKIFFILPKFLKLLKFHSKYKFIFSLTSFSNSAFLVFTTLFFKPQTLSINLLKSSKLSILISSKGFFHSNPNSPDSLSSS